MCSLIENSSSELTVCRISNTHRYGCQFLLFYLIASSSNGLTMCPASHTHCYGCPFLLFCLIADSLNGLTVCPSSHRQRKPEPCLMHTSSQTFCAFSDGFHTTLFAIIASHTVSRRVSDRSVALAASCSSEGLWSVGIPPQDRGYHNLCVKVYYGFWMEIIALQGVTCFTGIHFSLGSLHAVIA